MTRAHVFPRGYILIETMFACALLAVALSTSVSLIAEARRGVSLASHRQTAMSLARAKCAEIVSVLPTATADQATLVDVGATMPGFRWSWTTATTTLGTQSTPSITFAAREVTCNVSYPTNVGAPDDAAALPATDGRGQAVVKRVWMNTP